MRLKTILSTNIALGISIFGFSVLFPPFENQTTLDLSTHMLQHVLIILAGFFVAYPYLSSKVKGSYGLPAFLLVSSILVFWHLPAPWDDAVINPAVHLAEHFSFFLSGIVIGSLLVKLSDTSKISLLFAGFFGHTVYAVVLIYPSSRLYYLYSYADQYLLGVLLLLSGSLFLVGVGYIVARNPDWLGSKQSRKQFAHEKTRRNFATIKLAFTVIILIVLAAYSSVALALVSTSGKKTGPTVYIEETPFSWNYNPSNITVFIGINNTVTWVSHSISYDTVTDVSGSFSSGPIQPGGEFSYTFNKPGVYKYYCIYHPWMVGYVVVKR
jgi:plastocyanin